RGGAELMVRGAPARRYAKALFQLASENGQVPAVRAELDALVELLDASPTLAGVLLQPLPPVAPRTAVLEAVGERLGSGPLLRSFCRVLIEHRRLVDLAPIRLEYGRLPDEPGGLRRGTRRRRGAPRSA